MKNLTAFDMFESATDSYAPPKFAIKPAKNDKGYETVRKSYNRMMWTHPKLGKAGKIDKGETDLTNEMYDGNVYQGEIMGMGNGAPFPGETVGYTGPLKTGNFMKTDDYKDPDERERLKRIIHFDDFESEESEDDKEEDDKKNKEQ